MSNYKKEVRSCKNPFSQQLKGETPLTMIPTHPLVEVQFESKTFLIGLIFSSLQVCSSQNVDLQTSVISSQLSSV